MVFTSNNNRGRGPAAAHDMRATAPRRLQPANRDLVRLLALDKVVARPKLVCRWRRNADGELICAWYADPDPALPDGGAAGHLSCNRKLTTLTN